MREKIPKSASKQQFKADNETAEDIREKAMERLKQTKKRDSDEGGASPKRQNHWSTFCERKQRSKLRAKQQEQESQQHANDESYDDSAATTE